MGYADYLSSSALSRTLDRKAFGEWEEGLISTEECFNRYLSNNAIRKGGPFYHQQLFEHWLNSLGYRRYTNG